MIWAEPPRVCIDPGHPSEVGLGTSGRKLTEVHANWVIAKRVEILLKAKGIRVVLTKKSENEKVLNRKRAEIANAFHSDLMVRLHCDSSTPRGFAVYAPFKPGVSEGVHGPGPDVIAQSRRLGAVFHSAVKKSLAGSLHDNGFLPDTRTQVGKKQGALTGSVFSKVPVVLIEMVTLTRRSEEAFLSSTDGQAQMARAIEAGVLAALAKSKLRATK